MLSRERKLMLLSWIVAFLLFFFLLWDVRPTDKPEDCLCPLPMQSLGLVPESDLSAKSRTVTNTTRSSMQSLRFTPPPSTSTTASSVTLLPPRPIADAWPQLVELSRRANELQRQAQQAQCDRKLPTTDTGAWCPIAVRSLHIIDKPLAASLAELFGGKTVLSLGEGRGDYRQLVLNASSKVLRYDAYDGAPFTQESTSGVVRYIDLTLPQYWLPRYDWVLCLEVIEHIPKSHESVALDNIVRPASEGIVLSWAKHLQPGYGHINPRESDYVNATMTQRGLSVDEQATIKLRRAAKLMWFQENILVYRVSPT